MKKIMDWLFLTVNGQGLLILIIALLMTALLENL
jgi:hypothetical protein